MRQKDGKQPADSIRYVAEFTACEGKWESQGHAVAISVCKRGTETHSRVLGADAKVGTQDKNCGKNSLICSHLRIFAGSTTSSFDINHCQ